MDKKSIKLLRTAIQICNDNAYKFAQTSFEQMQWENMESCLLEIFKNEKLSPQN